MSNKPGGRWAVWLAGLLLSSVAAGDTADGAELKKKTLAAFKEYVSIAEANIKPRLEGKMPFLRVDTQPAVRRQVLEGLVPVENLTEAPGLDIPDGMVHDWLGTVFIPASPNEILAVLRDYDHHKEVYPEVIDSKTIQSSPDRLVGYLRLKKKKVITVVLDTKHEVFYQKLPENRWYIHSYSTEIHEISDFGEPSQKILPVGKGYGFLWALYSYWFLKPVEKGTIAECRAISLTRDIPFLISGIVKPFVTALPRESLDQTLRATRKAVVERAKAGSSN